MVDTGLGLLGVDWEERIDFARMRVERVEKAKSALGDAEVDAAFFFRLENVRYLTSLRHPHLALRQRRESHPGADPHP